MRRAGLRVRVVGGFAAGALLLSASMALVSYQVTRGFLLDGRERASVRAAQFDARVLRDGLATDRVDIVELLRSLDTGGNRRAVLRQNGQWYTRTADLGVTSAVPRRLLDMVESGRSGLQRVRVGGVPAVVVGIPLTENTALYEVDELRELDRTLRVLGWVLTVVAAAPGSASSSRPTSPEPSRTISCRDRPTCHDGSRRKQRRCGPGRDRVRPTAAVVADRRS